MFNERDKTKVHFIGIGGIGMSGLAEILLKLGYFVSGSDIKEGANILKLRELGAKISVPHHQDNIQGATVVVYTSAVDDDNEEIVASREKGIPQIKRAEMLSELMRLKYGIAIAGTHGKTTTTSFLATILFEAGIDATYIIGGIVKNLGGHASVGKDDILLAEADESDGSFLHLNPIMSVVTNIDSDHLENYQNSDECLNQAFIDFANKVPFYGLCAINIDDDRIFQIRDQIKRPVATFGIQKSYDIYKGSKKLISHYDARDIIYNSLGTEFNLYYNGEKAIRINILLPGEHNVLNALGAIAMAHNLGISFSRISKGIREFVSVGRRFEQLFKRNNLEIIDDYAHHPTEILATLKTLKEIRKDRVIKVIFEPHRYSRTEQCWDQFITCFREIDELYLLPIYAASESTRTDISSQKLENEIRNLGNVRKVSYLPSFLNVEEMINQDLSDENEVTYITLGAGAIGKNIREYVKKRKSL